MDKVRDIQTIKSSKRTLGPVSKASKSMGKLYQDSVGKADVNKIPVPQDYGKRQSSNVIDLRNESGSDILKKESLQDRPRTSKTYDINSGINKIRSNYPDIIGRTVLRTSVSQDKPSSLSKLNKPQNYKFFEPVSVSKMNKKVK